MSEHRFVGKRVKIKEGYFFDSEGVVTEAFENGDSIFFTVSLDDGVEILANINVLSLLEE